MEAPHSTALGVLLAAGSGTRFAGSQHKLLAHIDGQTIFSRSLSAMIGSHLDGFIVVSGALDLKGHIGDIEEVHNMAISAILRKFIIRIGKQVNAVP